MTAKEFGDGIAGLILLGLIAVGFYACSAADSRREQDAATIRASQDPTEVARLVLRSDTAKAVQVGTTLHVTYNMPENLTNALAIDGVHIDTVALVPLMFEKVAGADAVRLIAYGTLADLRGNLTDQPLVQVKFSRANSATIRWASVAYKNVPKLADKYSVHPALRR